ncbi:hypothetical protein STEG23_022587 [Scotinomys teguina]
MSHSASTSVTCEEQGLIQFSYHTNTDNPENDQGHSCLSDLERDEKQTPGPVELELQMVEMLGCCYESFMPRPNGGIWARFTMALLLLVIGDVAEGGEKGLVMMAYTFNTNTQRQRQLEFDGHVSPALHLQDSCLTRVLFSILMSNAKPCEGGWSSPYSLQGPHIFRFILRIASRNAGFPFIVRENRHISRYESVAGAKASQMKGLGRHVGGESGKMPKEGGTGTGNLLVPESSEQCEE